jgi:nucleoside-diphosphate-sugar epimerase
LSPAGIGRALRNEPITLYGDGTQTRSFCYVDDRIEGVVRLMYSPDGLARAVNLGNTGEFTMIELAEAAKELICSRSELLHQPLPQDDPRERQSDITRARATSCGSKAEAGATSKSYCPDCCDPDTKKPPDTGNRRLLRLD